MRKMAKYIDINESYFLHLFVLMYEHISQTFLLVEIDGR